MAQELTVQGEDGFDVQERSSNFIIGGMIKFNKNVYLLNKTEVINGDTIRLLVIRIITCWVRWWDHAPTEHRVTHSGQLHPERDDLPNNDKTLWQIGLDGEKGADPWVDTRYAHLINLQTGQDFTFIADTNGGRMAVGELKSSIRNVRMAHPKAMPIIKFGYDCTFMTKKFGAVARPNFIVVGWHKGMKDVPAQSDHQLLAPAKEQLDTFAKSDSKPTEQIVSELQPASLAEEMNDELPNFDDDTERQATKAVPPSRPRRELKKSPTKAGGNPPSKKRNILDAG
jgi:hypothetical protein